MNFQNPYGQQQGSIIEEIKTFFTRKDLLTRLMVINISVFAVINLLALILYIFNIDREFVATYGVTRLTYWLSLPSDLGSFLYRPWSIITYMFVQEDVFHLFFNMLILYVGGRIFTQFVGATKLLSTYVLSGITGSHSVYAYFQYFSSFSRGGEW